MTCRPDPRPSFAPPGVDWAVWQLVQALPAVTSEIRRLQRMRTKAESLLEERHLNADQHREINMLLDSFAARRFIFSGIESGEDPAAKGEDND